MQAETKRAKWRFEMVTVRLKVLCEVTGHLAVELGSEVSMQATQDDHFHDFLLNLIHITKCV